MASDPTNAVPELSGRVPEPKIQAANLVRALLEAFPSRYYPVTNAAVRDQVEKMRNDDVTNKKTKMRTLRDVLPETPPFETSQFDLAVQYAKLIRDNRPDDAGELLAHMKQLSEARYEYLLTTVKVSALYKAQTTAMGRRQAAQAAAQPAQAAAASCAKCANKDEDSQATAASSSEPEYGTLEIVETANSSDDDDAQGPSTKRPKRE